MASDNPLTADHYRLIKQSQRELSELIEVLDNAEACGMDCSDLRQAHRDFSEKLTAIETKFFPNPPPL